MEKIIDSSLKIQELSNKYSILNKELENLNNYIEVFDIENIFLTFESINLKFTYS